MECFTLKISGAFACFTRPEMKAERVSYEVMTPSAARGILEAVLWKPAMRWQIHRIGVLKPIRWQRMQRNELKNMTTLRELRSLLKGISPGLCIEDQRIQRSSLVLKDVSYLVEASIHLTDRAGPADNLKKFAAIFERRLARGQCFAQPYLGCREFSASFELSAAWNETLSLNRDLGFMLHDLDYTCPQPEARFFKAQLVEGILHVPAFQESVASVS